MHRTSGTAPSLQNLTETSKASEHVESSTSARIMQLMRLTAISPLDGRYAKQAEPLTEIFSEYGLIKYRTIVEIRWLQKLSKSKIIPEIPVISPQANEFVEGIISNFSLDDALEIKEFERTTNHDVKAIEYFLKGKVALFPELVKLKEFLHFGCTSEDINNLAYGLMLKRGLHDVILPGLTNLMESLEKVANEWAFAVMVARTHGQPATPTTMGKEIRNFVERLRDLITELGDIPLKGKFNGATGNFSALNAACPQVDWVEFGKEFVTEFGLTFNPYTTQIEPHDYIVKICDKTRHINNVLLGFCKDIWDYDKDEYFVLKSVKGEIGSSTMPHKTNPIDFENAEGNIEAANALFMAMSNKLPISRRQRDLSDSTVLRNLGMPFGHCMVAITSILRGLGKLTINPEKIAADLESHWELLAEPYQTVMRLRGVDEPYEKLKEFTRGKKVNKEMMQAFLREQPLLEKEKQRLLELTPGTYVGEAVRLALGLKEQPHEASTVSVEEVVPAPSKTA